MKVKSADLKATLRRKAYDARHAQQHKDRLSDLICRCVVDHPVYRQAQTVMWYLHCRSEVRTSAWVSNLLGSGKRIVVPYCTKDEMSNNKLGLWRLTDWSELIPGTWRILEPPVERWGEAGKEVAPTELDLVIVPGVPSRAETNTLPL